jgi:phosphotriesterase-related protein
LEEVVDEDSFRSGDGLSLVQLVTYGGPGYANVIENFLPMLRERGVSEADIHQMTVTNPARAFAFADLGERTS